MVNRLVHLLSASALMLGLGSQPATAASSPEQLIQANCGACHADINNPTAPYSRMSEQRKTPEGWQMTLFRMQHLHGVKFIDPAEQLSPDDVMRVLVRHFADTRGLTPAESAPYRYILEQRLNTIEHTDDPLYARMCARCHSEARVGLQRRSEVEWERLVHFHLAQFPTVEYSAGGRDRDWRGIALNDMVALLTERYGLAADDWSSWQQAMPAAPSGRWRTTGWMHGRGALDAVMTVEPAEDDTFAITLDGSFANGEPLSGSGRAVLYAGHEWRATVNVGEQRFRQVLALSPDGSKLEGRMFDNEHYELGLDLSAYRDNGQTQLIAAYPGAIRTGESVRLTILGTGLTGEPDLGPGIRVEDVLERDDDRMVLVARADDDASEGARDIRVGKQALNAAINVYSRLDRIEVSPAYAVGRVGGNGGSQSKVHALFDAIGWSAGPDQTAGTDDDIRVGPLPANWHVEPWDEMAARDEDVKFAGDMDPDTGVFTPAAAGPNPERRQGTNNAGNLKVIAAVEDGERTLEANGQLIVTVQRWNNPPIR